MFKLVVSFALLAVCSALYHVQDGNYRVDVMRDHIVVANKNGKEVHIMIDRDNVHQQQIFIQLLQQGQVLNKELIENTPVTLTGQYEADIIYQVFEHFKGIIDEYGYQRLMHIIERHVQNGHIHQIVLTTLQTLSDQQVILQLLYPQQKQHFVRDANMFQSVGHNQMMPFNKPGYFRGYGVYQRENTDMGHFGNWYGAGRQGYYYPETYGQDMTRQSFYGPYTRTFLGQGYGHHYGFAY